MASAGYSSPTLGWSSRLGHVTSEITCMDKQSVTLQKVHALFCSTPPQHYTILLTAGRLCAIPLGGRKLRCGIRAGHSEQVSMKDICACAQATSEATTLVTSWTCCTGLHYLPATDLAIEGARLLSECMWITDCIADAKRQTGDKHFLREHSSEDCEMPRSCHPRKCLARLL